MLILCLVLVGIITQSSAQILAQSLTQDCVSATRNIYWFGDSFSDTGALKYLNASLAVSTNTPFSATVIAYTRIAPDGSAGASRNTVRRLASNLGFNLVNGFEIRDLPLTASNLVNYAIIGASQVTNTLLFFAGSPAGLSVATQVTKFNSSFVDLFGLSVCQPNDVFVFFDIGANDLAILAFTLPTDPTKIQGYIANFTTNYVNQVFTNMDVLFARGLRRLHLNFFSLDFLVLQPSWSKLNTAYPGILALLTPTIAGMQATLMSQLNAALPTRYAGLQVIYSSLPDDLINGFQSDPGKYGIQQPLNVSQAQNFWPVNQSLPNIVSSQFFYGDDSHPTDHTCELMARVLQNWFDVC